MRGREMVGSAVMGFEDEEVLAEDREGRRSEGREDEADQGVLGFMGVDDGGVDGLQTRVCRSRMSVLIAGVKLPLQSLHD